MDRRVGRRIRERRKALGISMAAVAAVINVSWQQIQKVETGKSRITAAQLHAIAYELGAPMEWFFEVS